MSNAAFQTLVPDAQDFLGQLRDNNTRDWFIEHKPQFESELKQPAHALLDVIAPQIAALDGQAVTPKLFRANRDVRFSKDKTPYTTHLHMLWAHADGRGWFLGIAPDYVTVGAGVMQMKGPQLDKWRAAIDQPDGATLAQLLTDLNARMDPPELKRVPAPYDKTHPRGDLLRHKSMTLWLDDTDGSLTKNPEGALKGAFERLNPVMQWLSMALAG